MARTAGSHAVISSVTTWDAAAAGLDLGALAADAPAVNFFRTREIAADFFVVANSRVETLLPVSYYNR